MKFFVWRVFQLRNIQYWIKRRCIGIFSDESLLHYSTCTIFLHGLGLRIIFCWNHINFHLTVSKPYNLTCWHLTPLPSIRTGCMYWQIHIEIECLANGHVLNKLVWFYTSNNIEVCSYGHNSWCNTLILQQPFSKVSTFSISHKLNHIFIRVINLKGSKTYKTTALRMGIGGQRSGYLIKIKIAGLVTKICDFSL